MTYVGFARRALPVLLAVLASILVAATAPAAHALPASPADRTMFVTANLQEAYKNGGDISDRRDMKIFTNRLLDHTPYEPDVLLLQEVRRSSASFVASRLTQQTGNKYVIGFGGATHPIRQHSLSDTAVLLNTKTMDKKGQGGYITTRHDGKDKRHAWGVARRRGSDMSFPMVSVHTHRDHMTAASEKLADELRSKAPSLTSGRYQVLGGDFNQVRRRGNNTALAFWRNLTSRPHNYRDALYSARVEGSNSVDILFAKAGIYAAGFDRSYSLKSAKGDPSRFYSDHKFRWTVLGSDKSAPTVPANVQAGNVSSGVRLSWDPSSDSGDSGGLRYEVWRVLSDGGSRLLTTTSDTSYTHTEVFYNFTYKYYVVSFDGAENRSRPSETVRITHKKVN